MKQFRDTDYYVTVDGRVWSGRRDKFVKGAIDSYGYRVFKIRFGKTPKLMKAHRLVAECYLDNPKNKKTVNHIDGVKLNNHVCNLEWATVEENNKHAAINGLFRVPNRSFDKHDVLGIYKLHKSGESIVNISKLYNCNQSTIGRMVSGKTYKEYYAYY